MFLTMDCHAMSDIGRVRDVNEDQYLVAELKKSVLIHQTSLSYSDETELHGRSQAKLLMVADGVGGSQAGARASQMAVEGIVQYLLNSMHWLFRLEDSEAGFLADLKSALVYTQERIQHVAEIFPEQQGMGTTVTLAYLVWPTAFLLHAGDSRAYLYRGGNVQRLTPDQNIAQMMADAGIICAEQVDHHPFRHVLGSLLGCHADQLHPVMFKTRLEIRDKLLLCTDGLTRYLSDDAIAAILAWEKPARETCEALISAANDAGGGDNVTVVLASFRPQSTSALRATAAAAAQAE